MHMSIQIKNDPAGGYRPVVICDGCGEEITRAEDGTAAWVSLDEIPEYFGFSTLHSSVCFDEFELRAEAGGLVGDIQLPAFLIYLERGLTLDRKEAKHQARILSMFAPISLDGAHPSIIDHIDRQIEKIETERKDRQPAPDVGEL
jgi:hypothetical protein